MPKLDFFNNLKTRMLSECDKCIHSGWIGQKKCQCFLTFEKYYDNHEAGIDREYWKKELLDWQGDPKAYQFLDKYLKNLPSYFQDGNGMIFYGGIGTGKTLLSVFILKEA